jgi:sec-independent protein translocase protein TatB
MFDISWGKLVIIGVVALLVIGPKELPGVLRMVGQWMGKMRRMASEFQGQFQEAMREAEMADLKKQFDDTAASFTSAIDPSGMKADMEKLISDPLGSEKTATSTPATPPSDPAAPLATPATNTPEATPPTDPVALGTAPVTPAPEINVPMPELPPPVDTKDFAPPPSPSTSSSPAPSSAEPSAAPPPPAAEGGKAA